MVVITKLIMIGIAIVCAVTLAFIILDFVTDKVKNTSSKKRNRVHFYVARDKDGILWLYAGKPFRGTQQFSPTDKGNVITSERHFHEYRLNRNDYVNLKWEDEPLEVFLNMED